MATLARVRGRTLAAPRPLTCLRIAPEHAKEPAPHYPGMRALSVPDVPLRRAERRCRRYVIGPQPVACAAPVTLRNPLQSLIHGNVTPAPATGVGGNAFRKCPLDQCAPLVRARLIP